MENYSLSDVAAVTRGNDGYGYGCDGMGAWWMIILFAMIWGWGGNGFGNRGCNGEPVTEAGLCNSMNFNNLENAVGRISDNQAAIARQTDNAICQLGYQSAQLANQTQRDLCQGFASVNAGINQNRVDAEKCCCETNRNIDNVRYENAMNTASINANIDAKFAAMEKAQLQQTIAAQQNQINQLYLNSQLCGIVRYPTQTTFAANCNPFFNDFGRFGGCGGCGSGNI